MQTNDDSAARRARTLLSSEIRHHGGVKGLAMRSNLSEATIRKIAATGIVSTHVVAVSLEMASEGRMLARDIEQPGSKGSGLYDRNPARSFLLEALRRHVSVASLLSSYGISHQDLWTYMNDPARGSEPVRNRVRDAMRQACIPQGEDA